MGCCSSKQQAINITLPNKLVQQQIIHEEIMYLFGSTTNNQSVFYTFHTSNNQLKPKKTPQNYQPKNYSSMLKIQHNQYLITGGLSYQSSEISNETLLYNCQNNSMMNLSSMIQPRYTHNSAYYQQHVYVFGGRYYGQDNEAILSHCQRYKINDNKWQQLPNMPTKRCTGFSVIWNKKIYLFGGYLGEFQRPTKIDEFNPNSLKWLTLDVELSYGIQSGSIRCSGNNEFMIFGGLTNEGPSNKVITINLHQKTSKSNPILNKQSVLAKSIPSKQYMVMVGGSDQLLVQKYNINTKKSQLIDKKINKLFDLSQFEMLTHSQQTIYIPYSNQKLQFSKAEYQDQIVYIFGTNQQPFILEFNISIPSIQIRGVPLSMILYAHSGGITYDGKCILFGGIQDSLTTVSSNTYLYDPKTNSSVKYPNMITGRYAFSYLYFQQYIYVMGGGKPTEDGQLEILSLCQRFHIKQKKWSNICSLPQQVISPMNLIYKGSIYLFGGMNKKKQRQKKILRYSFIKNIWSEIQFSLPFGIQAGCIFQHKPNEFYIFGGRLVNGDTDGIWSLMFIQKQGKSDCIFIEKGRMSEPKCLHQIYNPKHQNFLVIFGGIKDLVACYDRQTLKNVESDTLLGIKQLFISNISNFNEPSMKKYLIIMKN